MFNWSQWTKGLFASVLTSIGAGGAVLFADPQAFNFTYDGLIRLGKVVAVVALAAFFNYLKTQTTPWNGVNRRTSNGLREG